MTGEDRRLASQNGVHPNALFARRVMTASTELLRSLRRRTIRYLVAQLFWHSPVAMQAQCER